MSSSTTGQKQRVQRSRGGCATCKTKKLKCDEQRPQCLMCLKKGNTCPGYERQFRWSTKHEQNFCPTTRLGGVQSQRSRKSKHSSPIQNTNPTQRDLAVDNDVTQPINDLLASWSSFSPLPCEDIDTAGNSSGLEENPASLPSFGFPTWDAFETVGNSSGLGEYLNTPGIFASTRLRFPTSAPVPKAVDLDGFSVPTGTSFTGPNLLDAADIGESTSDRNGSDEIWQIAPQRIGYSNITDLPSFLVTAWFTRICSMWSAFDSDINMNRIVALETWQNNEAVFYSLQSMAASYMIDKLPHLSPIAHLSAERGIQAIKQELPRVLTVPLSGQFPIGLALSLICLGTSLCWSDSKAIGSSFLRQTKSLLQHLNRFSSALEPKERRSLSFINDSCFYWDMLCRIVCQSEEIGPRWQPYHDIDYRSTSIPHPWTGISPSMQSLFASAVTLCRRFHAREKRAHKVTCSSLKLSLQDIEDAKRLEQHIRTFQAPNTPKTLDTGDTSTPSLHLSSVADAYRLAALLQLYETFEDLATDGDLDIEMSIGGQGPGHTTPHLRRLSTVFKLLEILEQIPPDSGSRSIQPILYLTASIGLRLDATGHGKVAEFDQFDKPVQKQSSGTAELTTICDEASLDRELRICQARYFVMGRMEMLERSLPSRPIRVARDLITAIWRSYDTFPNKTYWIDVMEQTGLYTIFG